MTGVGLCLPQLGAHVTAEIIGEFARRAEDLGYSSLWVQDHFMWPLEPRRGYAGRDGAPIPPEYRSVFAPTELLAYVAGQTSSVTLGTSILVAGNHWPVPLAQRLATIDQLSRGRLVVGLGVGWNAEEHEASGTDIATRGDRLDDFVPALLACWGPDPVEHHGPFFEVAPACVQPKPHQQPRPRLVSGMWSPRGLERTVAHFDGWNPAGLPVSTVASMATDMNARRRPDQTPLEIFYRAFVQRPLGRRPDDGDHLAALVVEAEAAQAAGFAEVILEHNFWQGITSPQDWLSVPERYLEVVRVVTD